MYVEGGGGYGEFSFSTCNFWKPTPLLFGIIFSLPTPSFHNPQLWAKYHEFLPPTHTLLHHFVCWCIIHWHFMWKIHSHIMFMHTKCANIIIIGLKYHHFVTESTVAIFNAINATYECCIASHNLCFSFLLGITAVPREIENNAYAKCGGKNGVFWEMCKWRKSDDRQFG